MTRTSKDSTKFHYVPQIGSELSHKIDTLARTYPLAFDSLIVPTARGRSRGVSLPKHYESSRSQGHVGSAMANTRFCNSKDLVYRLPDFSVHKSDRSVEKCGGRRLNSTGMVAASMVQDPSGGDRFARDDNSCNNELLDKLIKRQLPTRYRVYTGNRKPAWPKKHSQDPSEWFNPPSITQNQVTTAVQTDLYLEEISDTTPTHQSVEVQTDVDDDSQLLSEEVPRTSSVEVQCCLDMESIDPCDKTTAAQPFSDHSLQEEHEELIGEKEDLDSEKSYNSEDEKMKNPIAISDPNTTVESTVNFEDITLKLPSITLNIETILDQWQSTSCCGVAEDQEKMAHWLKTRIIRQIQQLINDPLLMQLIANNLTQNCLTEYSSTPEQS